MYKMIVKLKEIECSSCHKKVKENLIHQIPSGVKCSSCIKKERKKHRDYLLHDVAGVRRWSDLEKEWKEKRRIRELIPPKIKGEKVRRKKTSSLGLYITKLEKNFLYRKLKHEGLNEDNINERIKVDCDNITDLIKRLRSEGKSEEKINKIFKEEFSKLIGQ
jgi:hypothetical protein